MQLTNDTTRLGILRIILHWSRVLFTPVSLLVIAFIVWQSRQSYQDILEQANYTLLILAIGLYACSNLLSPLVTQLVFRSCNISIRYPACTYIHCSRLPGKYLPGGIWHSVGRANDYLSNGHAGRHVSLYFILENLLLVCVTMLLSAWIVAGLTNHSVLSYILRTLPVLCILVLLTTPFLLQMFGNGKMIIALRSYYSAIFIMVLYWILLSLCFICYLSAFSGLQLGVSQVETGAVYIFSWCIGYLALFAPQGIGISEFVSGNLLTGSGSARAILAFLFGFRLLALIADMLCWAGTKFSGNPGFDHDIK